MHSEPDLDEENEPDEEPHTELVVDVLHGWAQVFPAGTPQWQSEVNRVSLFTTSVHDLVVLYDT